MRTSEYILLGLQEGASLEEAEAAYRYWKRKYHAPDFDDEPAYAKRKIKELDAAYNSICRAHGVYHDELDDDDTIPLKRKNNSRERSEREYREEHSNKKIQTEKQKYNRDYSYDEVDEQHQKQQELKNRLKKKHQKKKNTNNKTKYEQLVDKNEKEKVKHILNQYFNNDYE